MEKFALKVHVVSASPAESARALILLSSISRNISVQVVPAGSLKSISSALLEDEDIDLLIFDVRCAAEKAEISGMVGNLAQKLILLTDDGTDNIVIKIVAPGQAGYVKKQLTYHKFAEGLGQIGIHLKKLNCWEFKQCGRGPGQTEESGLIRCPVSGESATNAMNEGAMGGRVCWAIGGSFCGGEIQGTFASKIINCQECDFYKLVHEEQGQYSESINSILGRMKRKKNE